MDHTGVVARRIVVAAAVAAAVGFSGLPAWAAQPTSGASTVTGVVQEIIVDNPTHTAGPEQSRRVLRAGDDVIPLADGSLASTENGATVRATLTPAGDGAQRVLSATTVAPAPEVSGAGGAADAGPAGGAADADPSTGAVAGAPVTHDVHAVIVRPKGIAADSRLTSTTVTTSLGLAASYWSSQTGGAVNFRVARVAPSYVSAYGCGDGTPTAYAEELMWDEALARISIDDPTNQHLMIFVPEAANDAGCAYGLGSIGAWPGQPGLTFVAATNQTVVAHELGHNLGLRHSNALRCGTFSDVANTSDWPGNCYSEEYGDLFDVMGYGGEDYGEGNLNAVHLDQMGHLPTAVQTISATGTHTVRIAPLSAAPATVRAVKIVEPTGETYYVEYRTSTGRDRMTLRNPWHPSLGVRVLRRDPRYTQESGSYVLDATPSWIFEYTNNLAVGRTFTSAARLVTVTVKATDSGGANLIITNGVRSVPARAILYGLPGAATVRARVTAAVKVINAAGRPVGNWPVTLRRQIRGGSYRTLGTVRTNVNGVAAMRVTHPLGATYRYVTVAGTDAPAKSSNVDYVPARAVAVAGRPAGSVAAGRRVGVSGRISPVPSPVVYIQTRRAGGAWSNAVRATVSGTAVSGRVRLPRRGTYHVRLYLKTDAGTRYQGDCSAYYIVKAV